MLYNILTYPLLLLTYGMGRNFTSIMGGLAATDKRPKMESTQINRPYLYVVVRKDLSFPQKCVQSIHSVFELTSLESFKPPQVAGTKSEILHPNVVLCEVQDERRLFKLAQRLEKEGVRCVLFQEPDLDDQYTSLATEIIYADRRFLFKNLQLVKETNHE